MHIDNNTTWSEADETWDTVDYPWEGTPIPDPPTPPILSKTILQRLQDRLPTELYIQPLLEGFIMDWQLYLQPQINPVAIPDIDVYNEAKWPPLANILITELVIYSVITNTFAKYVGASSSTSTGASSSSSGGGIKAIETGPSRTEWYGTHEQISAINKMFNSGSTGGNGIIDGLERQICVWASRIGVTLPFCEARKTNFLFDKAKRCPDNPFKKYRK